MTLLIINIVLGIMVVYLLLKTKKKKPTTTNLKGMLTLEELLNQTDVIMNEIVQDRLLILSLGKKTLPYVDEEIVSMTQHVYLNISDDLKANLLAWASEDFIIFYIQAYVRNSLTSHQINSVRQ